MLPNILHYNKYVSLTSYINRLTFISLVYMTFYVLKVYLFKNIFFLFEVIKLIKSDL